MSHQEVNPKVRFNTQATIDIQFLAMSDDCLMIQRSGIQLALNYAFGGVLAFLFLGLPAFLMTIIAPWLPPYGYTDDGVKIETLSQLLNGYDITQFNFLGYFLFVFVLGGFFILISLGYALFCRSVVTKKNSPLVFNRKSQNVSAIVHKKDVSIPWSEISGDIRTRTLLGPAMIPGVRDVIEFDHLTSIDGGEKVWEYLSIFMEEGPQVLSVPVYKSDMWDHQSLYSRTFKQAVKHHWFWPIEKNPLLGKIISYVIWPIRVVMFIPFVVTDWYWRRMCLKSYEKSNCFPDQRFAACGCGDEKITGDMATKLYKGKTDDNGINYLELKRRLAR